MRYTCDLLDKACVDRMNTYQALGLVFTIIVILAAYYGGKWFDSRKKKRREEGKEDFPMCIDRCDRIYLIRESQLECYRNCAWYTFR